MHTLRIPTDDNSSASYTMAISDQVDGDLFSQNKPITYPNVQHVAFAEIAYYMDFNWADFEDYLDNLEAEDALHETRQYGSVSLDELKRDIEM